MAISSKMFAVLRIIGSDEEVRRKVSKYIDRSRNTIDWYSIFNMNYSASGHAGLIWAKAIWDGASPTNRNCFDLANQMTKSMRVAVLAAIESHWLDEQTSA